MKQLRILGDLVQHTESYLLYRGKNIYEAPERLLELLLGIQGQTISSLQS